MTRTDWLEREKREIGMINYIENEIKNPSVQDFSNMGDVVLLDLYKNSLLETQTHIQYLKDEGMWETMQGSNNINPIMDFKNK